MISGSRSARRLPTAGGRPVGTDSLLMHAGCGHETGFGLGLERVLQFITGMDNIRDVIPFPRTPGHADVGHSTFAE